jgi:hypothetical protein
MLCAYLAAALLVGLLGNAAFGAWWLDPAVGLLIASVAVKEGLEAWRGEGCACSSYPLAGLGEDDCHDDRFVGARVIRVACRYSRAELCAGVVVVLWHPSPRTFCLQEQL